ncbi:MAG: hypothetical protein SGPRY_013871 [Prymnesium sp.]
MDPNKAQTVLASAQRGRKTRVDGASKLSKIWQAMRRADPKALAALCSAVAPSELRVLDPEGRTPLRAAIEQRQYDCAKVLLEYDEALSVGESELRAWRLIQKSKVEAELEDTEEPVDVTDADWQKEQSDAIFGPDADEYLFKSIVTIGVYEGARATRDPAVEPTFDSEVTHRCGFGTALAPHGDVFVGSFGAGGLRCGEGALRLASGGIYVGSWLEGLKHGPGMMAYPDGGVYKGSWEFGKRHGHGTFVYANGDAYTGEWHAGAKHGEGRYRQKEFCCTYEGTWQHGVLLSSKVVCSDGSAFYGKFDKTGRPTGAGAYMFSNGCFEEEDGEEPPTVLPSTWKGNVLGPADSTQDVLMKRDFCAVKPVINAVIAGPPASGKG